MITTDDLKQKIIEGLSLEDVEIDEIGDTDQLFGDDGLGLDSVDAIELTLVLEREYGVKITDMSKAQDIFATAESLCKYINAQSS